MSEPVVDAEETSTKKSKKPMLIGLILAIAGGSGGFFATWSGMLLGSESHASEVHEVTENASAKTAFVPVEQLVISLNAAARAQHLLFRAELEVPESYAEEVQGLLPRVVDVMNTYLRALDPGDLEDPSALTRLRAQMLRRVQVVAGQGRINDLLVMEFVLN
jgi:flagellar FliL protein